MNIPTVIPKPTLMRTLLIVLLIILAFIITGMIQELKRKKQQEENITVQSEVKKSSEIITVELLK